jgi:hypothetical protein
LSTVFNHHVFNHHICGLPIVPRVRAKLQQWLTAKSISHESVFELSYPLLQDLELGLGSEAFVELPVYGLLELFAAIIRWLPFGSFAGFCQN